MGLTSRDDFRQLGRLRGKRRTALRQRIIEENINLVYAIAKRRFRRIDPGELIGVGCEGLMRAVDRFDPERGYEFSTYASRAIWSHMLRSLSQARPTAELFDGLSVPERGGDRLLAQEAAGLINRLPDRQRRAVWLRFWRDKKLEDIGKEMGISKERARQLILHGITRLREMYGLPRSRDGARLGSGSVRTRRGQALVSAHAAEIAPFPLGGKNPLKGAETAPFPLGGKNPLKGSEQNR